MSVSGASVRAYRALLRLTPRRLRERHADEMTALFAERLAAARRRGPGAVGRVWLAAAADVLVEAARCRVPSLPTLPDERMFAMTATDLKYTARWLSRQRFSTSLVVAMLTIAIAANVVVFSLVNGLFLRPFPFPEPDRLVYINETAPKWNLDIVGINYPDFHRWQSDARAFEALGLYDLRTFNLSDDGGARRIEGAGVTYDFARTLGVQPLLGRMFSAEEDRPRGPSVVVLGERLWRERFGGRREAIGRVMKLDGVAHEIIGVMPQAAEFPQTVALWVPYGGDPNAPGLAYGPEAIGRLKPGVSAEDAQNEMLRVHEAVWKLNDPDRNVSPFLRPLRAMFVRNFTVIARVLLGATTLLLVVACANVASVMLARALARRREMGIRLAVGASRLRLLRQLLVENLLLAAAGATLGLLLGRWALAALLQLAGDQVPRWASFDFDPRVIAFSVVLMVLTTVLFGWAPALHALRGDLRGAMHQANAASSSAPRARRTLHLLVAAEFALAAILVVGGGLFLRAYARVQNVDPGFNPARVLTFGVALPAASYRDDAARLAFWDRLAERIAAMPGVEASGLVNCPPLTCHWGTFYVAEGAPSLPPGAQNPVVLFRPASPGYFEAMGVRLKSGRFFEPADGRRPGRVAIVNESFVKTFWPNGGDAVGRRFRGPSTKLPWITIVGVVEDVKHYGLERPMRPGVYIPMPQLPAPALMVAVRTAGEPSAFIGSARAAVRDLDPELPIYDVRTMEELLTRSLNQRTLYSWLIAVFAGIALVLALGGAYGVTTFAVSQRTREIGIRVALGARRADILRTVLRGAVIPIAIGIALGITGAFGASGWMTDLLFDVKPSDVTVLATAGAVLLALAILINWLPARRAAGVDPMQCLRSE